ncbi:MAG: hypothetical protein H0W68_07940 [Gemmatimonadaceae bacterium]|nr:hypothetical protein [Gemmatimonadaceae bacterium]
MGRSRHSLAWRVGRALESATASRPVLQRSGPAWAFGLMGTVLELVLAPVVLMLTFAVGLASYLILDAPWTKVRVQQRPRFVSVRILYLNTLIVAGFWLAVMFIFSAADPSVSSGVEQRLPMVLDVANARDLRELVSIKKQAMINPVRDPVGAAASTWFDVFLHGLVGSFALNFMLYGVVIARRRQRSRSRTRGAVRSGLHYNPAVGLFVDEAARPPQ